MSNSIIFNNVYVCDSSTVAGLIEKQGPLGKYFDNTYDDLYCGCKTFEQAEQKMLKESIDIVLKKTRLRDKDIDIMFGGDLLNQITSSTYVSRDYKIPLIGTFGACSSSMLTLALASSYVEAGFAKKALAFTSSHNATAERQFRYPNEYGIQKPNTTTYTATGAGAIIVSNIISDIKVTSATIGEVTDYEFDDANNMGVAMAPAAYKTLTQHFKDLNRTPDYYDLILTGDLSTYGKRVILELFKKDNIELGNDDDCGLIIYDRSKQKVFAGGSGCACCALTTYGYILDKMRKKELKKILIVATGALLSPTLIQQKESIPCIAHAVSLEVIE
jgi:stage V sporulation protein AD